MESFLVYLLKSGTILLLFLASYRLFLKKETFFVSNRFFLLIGLLSSFLVPFITFTRTVYVNRLPLTENSSYTATNTIAITEISEPFNWIGLISILYLIGVLFFGSRLIFQLWTLKKMKNSGSIIKHDNFIHVKTEKHISPFSFFKYIFYNPQLFKRSDLKIILNHEEVHASQLHSFDVLFSEIVFILQWFNPIIWFYRKSVKENLEFLADAHTCVNQKDKKHYQYLILQKGVGENHASIVNPFFNSLIKKRIVMLNQNQSKKLNTLKLLIVLPLILAFLMAFNIKEEVKFSTSKNLTSKIETETIDFRAPINQNDIKRISAGFGLVQNKLEKNKFHNGIDLVAEMGTKVMSSSSGTVKISSNNSSNGNYIIIDHKSGYSTKYMHLKDMSVNSGEQVELGATIGHVGNTGKSTGPHLHFEILKSDKPINPESLVAFKKKNPETIKKQVAPTAKIELIIDKDTTNEELEVIKKDLEKDGVDFSYTVVHNEKMEIIDISIQIAGKSENGGSFNSSYNSSDTDEKGISPLVVLIDQEHNLVSIGSKGTHKSSRIKIHTDSDQIWVDSDEKHKEIRIKKVDGKRVVIVDGEEVSEDELEDMDIHMEEDSQIFISKKQSEKGSNVFIHSDSDDDHNIQVISKKGNGFFFSDTEGDKEPLFIIDGKESSSKKVKRLDSDNIKSIDISKGEKAIKKYGKKAKDGVVVITTKEN